MRVEDASRHVTLNDGTGAGLPGAGGGLRRHQPEARRAGVEELTGAGIYGAALTEAASHRGEHVLVGGANRPGRGHVLRAMRPR